MAASKRSEASEKKKAAQEKRVQGWKEDLVSGSPRKRETATRRLAEVDRDETRRLLLAELETAKGKVVRRSIATCLHLVADLEVARKIANEEKLDLSPRLLSSAILTTLYDDLRNDLSSISLGSIKRRIEKLEIFDDGARYSGMVDEERDARRELYLAILDNAKLSQLHQDAARGLRDLDDPRGWSELIARWARRSDIARPFDVLAAWLRLDDATSASEALVSAVIADLARNAYREASSAMEAWTAPRAFSAARLAARVERIPAAQLRGLVTVLGPADRWTALTDAVANRIVSLADDTDALVALLDDRTLAPCHGQVAKELARSAGTAGARLVIERARRLEPSVLETALGAIPASEVFDLLKNIIVAASDGDEETSLYGVLLSVPAALRDPRWLEVAPRLPLSGRSLLVTMARDPKNPARTKAVDLLAEAVKQVTGRIEKREAVHALGQTCHPHATLYLVEALDDPELADGAPLICTALSSVGDTRAIPILEQRTKGPHANFIASAIEHIRARVKQIHADVLLAATQDEDPVIADLARQAQAGDQDSAIVLEDALRERGRL